MYTLQQDEFEVKGLQPGLPYRFEWTDVAKMGIEPAASVTPANMAQRFSPPCAGAVLTLTPGGAPAG